MADAGVTLRVPPHSEEAEQSVLGAVLIDNAAFHVVAALIGAEHFYRHEHRLAFEACAGLICAGRTADVVTVYERLHAGNSADAVGGLAYLNALAQSVPSASHARHYAEIVLERALLRRLVALGDEIANAGFNPQNRSVAALADGYAQALLELAHGANRDEPRRVGDLLVPWIDDFQARAEGRVDAISTGWVDVDDALGGGLRRGELVTLAARPSMGKSAWMGGLGRQVARQGPVLVCSLEDSDAMFVARQIAATGRVNLAHLRLPAKAPPAVWDKVSEGVEALTPLPLYIDDAPALSVQEVRHRALQVKRRERELLLVVVDYLQLMEGEGDTRAQQLSGIARGLKAMAKALGCAVLVLSQLNREADKISGPPRLDHLAETDGLEQASDIIGLLWRPHRRKPTEANKYDAQVEFAKNKNGACTTVNQWFDGATQRFENRAQEASDGA